MEKKNRSVVVTSGKGGVGKTTVTASLGRALAELNLRVVVMDTDVGLNNLDVVTGVENRVVFDFIDVIENRCRPREALVEDPSVHGLYVMPSAHSYGDAAFDGQNVRAVINSLLASFDYVLVDCPAGIETGFHRAVSACSEALVVTTPHVSAIKDADKVVKLLCGYSLPTQIIVNRARGDLAISGDAVDPKEIESFLGVPLLGVVPEDDEVNVMSNTSKLRRGAGQKAFSTLAKNLHFGTREIFDATGKYRGFFGGLRRGLKRLV